MENKVKEESLHNVDGGSRSYNRHVAVLDQEKCVHCGVCIVNCKEDAIMCDSKEGREDIYTIIEGVCNGCGCCEQVCPIGCIKVKEKQL